MGSRSGHSRRPCRAAGKACAGQPSGQHRDRRRRRVRDVGTDATTRSRSTGSPRQRTRRQGRCGRRDRATRHYPRPAASIDVKALPQGFERLAWQRDPYLSPAGASRRMRTCRRSRGCRNRRPGSVSCPRWPPRTGPHGSPPPPLVGSGAGSRSWRRCQAQPHRSTGVGSSRGPWPIPRGWSPAPGGGLATPSKGTLVADPVEPRCYDASGDRARRRPRTG